MMLSFCVVCLWLDPPGQLYKVQSDGTEYSLRADLGRLLLVQWSGQAGLNVLWNLPLWPFVVATALLPLWILWKFGPHRPKRPPGFPVEQKRSP